MTLYMKVTRDKYELPLIVADSKAELARRCGVQPSTIAHSTNKNWTRPTYVVVEIEDDEEVDSNEHDDL